MKFNVVKIFTSALLVFTFSCSDFSPSETNEQLKVKRYFDLEGFFKSEIERLSSMERFKKTTYVNEESEVKEVTEIDLEKELAIFSNSDINRPAWSDKYSVDSVFNEKRELVQLNYETSDEKLRTRQISIDVNGGAVTKIRIRNITSTAIANTDQSLLYEPVRGYSIESRQNVKTIDEAVLRVEVSFISADE